MRLFVDAVLRNRHGAGIGCHGAAGSQGFQRASRYVFKFSGDGGAQRAKLRQAWRIAVVGLDVMLADQASRALRIRVEHGGGIAHALRGMHKHAAELAAAHHAQRGGLAGCRQRAGENR